MNFISTNKYFFLIILTIATLIIPKLIISNFFYPNEENFVSFVFENPGSSYLPIIKSYSEFDLNPSYMTGGGNSQLISFPYLAVFINSIFLKFFQSYSFIIVEFISFLFFFLIFTKILNYCGFEKIEATIITFFLFLIPTLLTDLQRFDIQFINLIKDNYINFYSDRIPRPLVTNLYFFLFILLLIKLKIDETFDLKTAFYFGITMGLSFHSFFPHFFIEFFTFLFLFIYNKYLNIKNLIQNNKFYLVLASIISLFIFIFFLQFNFSNPDHLNIIGTKSVNLSQKIILIKYFLYFIFNKIFIVLFVINSVLFFLSNKKEKELQIFYLLFICSIISFIFFIIISNKSTHYYLFQNWILINGTIYPFLIISKYFINYLKSFNFNYKRIFFLLIIFNIFYYNLSFFINYDNSNQQRNDTNQIMNLINSQKIKIKKEDEILIFDTNLFTLLALNNYQNFSIVPNSFWTNRSIENIENNLISSFKILGFDEVQFSNFFENKITSRRIINSNTIAFFGHKYLSNSIHTYKSSSNFKKNELEIIKSTSPFYSEQSTIPLDELDRFKNIYFNETKINKPNIIILSNNFIKKNKIQIINYENCSKFSNKTFKIFKEENSC